jgi:hypothetical protein
MVKIPTGISMSAGTGRCLIQGSLSGDQYIHNNLILIKNTMVKEKFQFGIDTGILPC